MKSATSDIYTTLDEAYYFFNVRLFQSELPDCVIVLQRKGKNNLGFFAPERYTERTDKKVKSKKKAKMISELSLNPTNFHWQTDEDVLSVLVHEMCHVWQFHCTDKYPRNGYHDKKWGAKMKEVGLFPSKSGEVGGKETGQQMHHYILIDGKFTVSAKELLKGTKLHWNRLNEPVQSSKKNKVCYACPGCNVKAWAKPDVSLICGECEEPMTEA